MVREPYTAGASVCIYDDNYNSYEEPNILSEKTNIDITKTPNQEMTIDVYGFTEEKTEDFYKKSITPINVSHENVSE